MSISIAVSGEYMQALAQTLRDNSAQPTLNLEGAGIGDFGLEQLSVALHGNHTVIHLDLTRNNIGPEGAAHLAVALSVTRTLNELVLTGNRLGNLGIKSLATMLGTLTYLDLSRNGITNIGARYLGEGLGKNSTLTVLNLGGNGIEDEGAVELARGIGNNHALISLLLCSNKIVFAIKDFITLMQHNPTLTRLDFTDNKVNNADIIKLNQALDLNNIRNLHSSIIQAEEERAKIVINQQAAYINCVDEKGNSALHVATMHGRLGITAYLLARDVDTLVRNQQGKTAMQIAQEHQNLPLMMLLSMTGIYFFRQWRSADHLYLFKITKAGGFVLKIMDIQQQQLFKREFSPAEIASWNAQEIFASSHFPSALLKMLRDRQLIPQGLVPTDPKPITLEYCLSEVKKAIEQFKPTVLISISGLDTKNFECPLSLELFEDPVVDGDGHTFERSAIETHLRVSNECPISRKTISLDGLATNFTLKALLDDYRTREPIPHFSLFKKENPRFIATYITAAQEHTQLKEYQEALEAYTKAFAYTKKWSDYVGLPRLFIEWGKPGEATLAYLYLAQYQLEDGKIVEAVQTLEQCQKSIAVSPLVDCLLTTCRFLTMYDAFQWEANARITANNLLQQNHKPQASTIYKQILTRVPRKFDLYLALASLLTNPNEKNHLLLQGACHALENHNRLAAQQLCDALGKETNRSFYDQLVVLSLPLPDQDRGAPGYAAHFAASLNQKLQTLSIAFNSATLSKQALQSHKLSFQLTGRDEDREEIINLYETLQKPEKAIMWSRAFISSCIEKQKWAKAEAAALRIIPLITSPELQDSFYEDFERIYTNWNSEHLETFWEDWGAFYQAEGKLAKAEAIFRKAYDRFKHPNPAINLAGILAQQGKTQESVQMYYQGSFRSFLTNVDKIDSCMQHIEQIDPTKKHLTEDQRTFLARQLETRDTINGLLEQVQRLESEKKR